MQKNIRPPKLSLPGLILLGANMEPIACNAEAMQILCFPAKPSTVKRVTRMLAEKLPAALHEPQPANGPSYVGEFVSGKRQYVCNRYILEMHGQNPTRTLAIILERAASPEISLHHVCTQFNLTPREREAVSYLLQGLTSKEIAQKMNISPNTVKAFLRLVMTKTGVTTRAGLIGRIAGVRPHAAVAIAGGGSFFDH